MDKRQLRGQILKDLRKSKNLSQSELATMLDIKQQAYQRYENGTSEPNADRIELLADFYGVTTDYLLGREKPKEEDIVDVLARELRLSSIEMTVIRAYLNTPKEYREGFVKAFCNEVDRHISNTTDDIPPEYQNMSVSELEEKRDLLDEVIEKKQALSHSDEPTDSGINTA
ncbi:MAG: helix-turn-helix transcriptional regulator [Firmicutes bacterium]|nr:helix-turn-helix transcriptional regulator [Bacillota bacterium]